MSIHVPDAKNIKLINNKWNIYIQSSSENFYVQHFHENSHFY